VQPLHLLLSLLLGLSQVSVLPQEEERAPANSQQHPAELLPDEQEEHLPANIFLAGSVHNPRSEL